MFDPAIGACKCPPGTVMKDGKCIRVQTLDKQSIANRCQPPMIPGPTPGSCVCPPGMVTVDGKCEPVRCRPPLVLNPVTGVCECPNGGVLQNGRCVPQVCPSPLVPGPCECPRGTVLDDGQCVQAGKIPVKKEVKTEGTLIPWPTPGPLFPMTLTCTAPPQSWTFSLNNNGYATR